MSSFSILSASVGNDFVALEHLGVVIFLPLVVGLLYLELDLLKRVAQHRPKLRL